MTTSAQSLDVLRSRVAGLQQQLQAFLKEPADPGSAFARRKAETEAAHQRDLARAREEHEARLRDLADGVARRRREIEERHARDLARIRKRYASAVARAGRRSSLESVRVRDDRRKALEKDLGELEENRVRLAGRVAAELAAIEELRGKTRALRDQVALLASGLKVPLRETPPDPADLDPVPAPVLDAVRRRLAETGAALEARQRETWVRFSKSCPGFTVLALILLLAYGAGFLAMRELAPDRLTGALPAAGVSFAVLLAATVFFRAGMRGRGRRVVDPLVTGVLVAESLLQRQETLWRGKEKQVAKAYTQGKAVRASGIEERFRELGEQTARTAEIRTGILNEERDRLLEKAGQMRDARLAREDERRDREDRDLQERHAAEVAQRHALLAGQVQAMERAESDRRAGAWLAMIREFQRTSEEARRKSRERLPPWGDPLWQRMAPPADFPDGVYLGDVRLDVNVLAAPETDLPAPAAACGDVTAPLELTFPEQGNLFLGMEPETRERALQGLFSTILRILCAFPPGKAKFTLFDPVGLGQNFSAFMHLADHEESLVGGRIWTETVHFERKLAELTEHIEKVIQKYLRNRYRSIDEYNREVGPLAEPYRFLVVADFPTGFSDLALERLASIVTSGARCGVHALILRDRKQKLPPALQVAGLKGKGAGFSAHATEAGFLLEDEAARRGVLAIEPPPPPEALTALLNTIGRRCVEAARVELAFDSVAPKEGQLWSQSAEGGVRIPLGRASADRLQYLELGRGTAQHALVAGKTGSGKSTLFHVMVTNAALWYAPGELELYLIDFKKGVEFKTYAVHGLPHARVVAIESDREFGLSVLRRIDRELTDRAERYRTCGVQDFASHRKAEPASPLPRTLLLIDEFQEFFVEEDAIAQSAALLLDRIVRQGRAFGVHVVLGSQTLGGSYTLARTTLGQMAVRIALQCNEADSYLILNDENSAARLLSRPGEAIYNDMSGMVEGNNPFQVAWLPDEVRDQALRRVKDRAARDGTKASEPMTVFEGNVPADLRNNPHLKERLARPFQPVAGGAAVAWIGEANAIKGPTEVRFRSQGSSNLLVVGQQREAALSVLVSSVVSLAASHPVEGIRFVVLDGSPPELGHGRHFAALAAAIPHRLDVVDYANVPAVLEDLHAEVTGRMEGKRDARQRIILVLYDIQRFRMLRQKSEFDFSGKEEEEKPPPDKCFATLLGEGPAQGIHCALWSDSLNNLNRTLDRKSLKEFQMRVLFQMSGADSSELIDTPLAGSLGLYRGLLFLEENGTVEKFRPYALPDAETMETIRKGLRGGTA